MFEGKGFSVHWLGLKVYQRLKTHWDHIVLPFTVDPVPQILLFRGLSGRHLALALAPKVCISTIRDAVLWLCWNFKIRNSPQITIGKTLSSLSLISPIFNKLIIITSLQTT